MTKTKDTDFLYATTRIRSLERFLLSREQTERMLDAKTDEDAAKILAECGYEEFSSASLQQLEEMLSRERLRVYTLLLSFIPRRGIVNVFRIKYDYHNLKAIIKSEARLTDGTRLLINAGRFEPSVLTDAIRKSDYTVIPKAMQHALLEAQDILARTSDPQLSDLVLDRACYAEMLHVAEESGSDFLTGYVRLTIDAANLKIAVRSARIGKSVDFLRRALIEGGNIGMSKLLTVATGTPLEKIFYATPLERAAAYGDEASSVSSEATLSELEQLSGETLDGYLIKARMVPFGEAPIIAYMAAKEQEYTVIRTILSGRLSGVPSDYIRQRLSSAGAKG